MDAYVKRPGDTIDVHLDLRLFVLVQSQRGVASSSLTFQVRSDLGITVTSTMTEVGLINAQVSGGAVGRVYQLAAQASAPDGDTEVASTLIRLRDPILFNLLPGGTTVTPPVGGAFADGLAWSDGGSWSD